MELNKIKELIQSKGLKATPQRIAVYQAMKDLNHASADMLIEKVLVSYPTLTVATVYNILESFVDVGLLKRLISSNIKMYFDVDTHEHIHMFCEDTQQFKDFDDSELVSIVNNYLKEKNVSSGFSMSSVDILIKGVSK